MNNKTCKKRVFLYVGKSNSSVNVSGYRKSTNSIREANSVILTMLQDVKQNFKEK